MSFERHRENFRSDGGARSGSQTAPGAHRINEYPAGYSSPGCSPAAPASASPAALSMREDCDERYVLAANGSVSTVSTPVSTSRFRLWNGVELDIERPSGRLDLTAESTEFTFRGVEQPGLIAPRIFGVIERAVGV